jgi:integrase
MGYKLYPPGTRRKNSTFVVRGTVNGIRFEERTGKTTRGAADQWALEFCASLEGDGSKKITFERAALAYVDFRRPRRDDERHIARLIRYFAKKPLRDMHGADLVAAAHALFPKASNATKNRNVIGIGAAILHYAEEQKWCDYKRCRILPVSRRSPRKPVPALTMRLLLSNTEGQKRAFLAFLYETGARVTDALRLTWEDVDLQLGIVRLGSSKTDDHGELGLSPDLIAMLANAEKKTARVFSWGDRHNVYRWLKPLCTRLGVAFTPHQSRHAMATDMKAMGYEREEIAERGLWRDARSVERYIHHRSTAPPDRNLGTLLAGQFGGKKTAGS